MKRAHSLVLALLLILVLSLTSIAQVVISEQARNSAEFREAWENFLATEEGKRILFSTWVRSITGTVFGGGQPVHIEWVPNGELDPPPPATGAYGNATATFDNNNKLSGPIVIKIRSVKTNGAAELADTIHHELRHAEIWMQYGSTLDAKNPGGAATSRARHQDLDDGKDLSNNKFKLELLLNDIRDLLRRLGSSVQKILSPVFSYTSAEDLGEGFANPFSFSRLIHEALVQIGDTNELVGSRLVTSLECSDEDRTELLIHLATGLTFSDGTSFTAEDVVFTYRRLMESDGYASEYCIGMTEDDIPLLKEVEKIDDYTVRFTFRDPVDLEWEVLEHLETPLNPLWELAWIPILSSELEDMSDSEISVTGLGPYSVEWWSPYDRLALRARRDTPQGYEYVETAEFVSVDEPTSLRIMFECQDLNLLVLPTSQQMSALSPLLEHGDIGESQTVTAIRTDWQSDGSVSEVTQYLLVVGESLASGICDLNSPQRFGGIEHTSKQGDWKEIE